MSKYITTCPIVLICILDLLVHTNTTPDIPSKKKNFINPSSFSYNEKIAIYFKLNIFVCSVFIINTSFFD